MASRLSRCLPFLHWGRSLDRRMLGADLMAGLTGAILVLPQGVAYAFIAGLPPEVGLYTAIVAAIVAALFGSSWHMVSGPTAALSIVLASVVGGLGPLEPSQYLAAALTVTLLVGLIQLAMGLLRLGSLVSFISHTVVIGFTAGAAILIAASQLKHLLGLSVAGGQGFLTDLSALVQALPETNPYALAIGLISLLTSLLIRRLNRRWPHLLLGLAAGSLACLLLDGEAHGVALVGALPGTLPPLTLPELSPDSLRTLTSGAFAIALLGLIEAVSIARAIALRSHQVIDGNQEFIGQGLSNIVGGLFSCYASSGSFTRSGANYDAGARTPLAAIFAAVLLALILVLAPGITAYLPLPAMAGGILLIAWNLIDASHIGQLVRASRHEALILTTTIAATLLVALEFAIYIGVLLSLVLYLKRTSRPTILEVAPRQDHPRRHIRNVQRYALPQCPQLKILRIDGSLFFGASDHVQRRLRALSSEAGARVLIIGKGINFIDTSGIEMLLQEIRRLHQQGGELVISSLKGNVLDELRRRGDLQRIGEERCFETPSAAIAAMAPALDRAVCGTCHQRIFTECGQETDNRIPVTVV
ncbi:MULTISPECIES: SulP family inorganic anion transporter [unclassified Halomonas]|uniref:SulP family inorganic anion transporter n=1 Tax=unclassified Halomonas TaxID=2609666 RepID=UPI0028877B0A|nr:MULTISPECIES: SulP family inorganic anion transporter [unclassified Halomonas]MDT0502686.1 SulP family inorganic anion transporter [Halomonas sp. PAR7]MDT0512746.1 SulP family inorganic anion transporter [Halomonas sp. LES1]MDT0591936.1 SulP family inorganic anion transporter [Halomonas sp. PAR8]